MGRGPGVGEPGSQLCHAGRPPGDVGACATAAPPTPAPPLPVVEAEERMVGRAVAEAVAYMWELLHDCVGFQRSPKWVHEGVALGAVHHFMVLVNGQLP